MANWARCGVIKMQTRSISNPNFGSGVHVYFYTKDGKRILSDKNMKKCIHYMEAHLNNSKRVKVKNQDLIDTFMFGQKDKTGKRIGGDRDYYYNKHIRTVLDNTKGKIQGFINIATGNDSKFITEHFGKPIGRAKGLSRRRSNSVDSFETAVAVKNYIENAPKRAELNPILRNGKRQAFGIIIDPIKVNRHGEIKMFNYIRSGYFDEEIVNKNLKQ